MMSSIIAIVAALSIAAAPPTEAAASPAEAAAPPTEADGEDFGGEQSSSEASADATDDAAATTAEAKAEQLYEQGNEHFVARNYTEALERYQEAIDLWDHPAIRFNMAECYVSLVQPVRAYENLELALASGPEALESESLYERGVELRGRLLAQLGRITVTNVRPGTRVTIDGQAVDPTDGKAVQMVLPGGHEVVASAEGFVTATTPVMLSPGEAHEVPVSLEPLPPPLVTERRWARWMPWTVGAIGAATAIAGFPLLPLARSDYEDYDRAVTSACEPPNPCPTGELPPGTVELRESGDRKLLSAQVLWAVGAAGVVTGAILLILNRPRTLREGEHKRKGKRDRDRRVTIGGGVGSDGGARLGTWRF